MSNNTKLIVDLPNSRYEEYLYAYLEDYNEVQVWSSPSTKTIAETKAVMFLHFLDKGMNPKIVVVRR